MAKKKVVKKTSKKASSKKVVKRKQKNVVEGALSIALPDGTSPGAISRAEKVESAMADAIKQAYADGHGGDPEVVKKYIRAAIDRERGE